MKHSDRRSFFQQAGAGLLAGSEKSPLIEDYKDPSNKVLPTSLAKTSTGTATYTGTWGDVQLQHLLRRTMFGATKADYAFFKNMTMAQAVDQLLTIPSSPPAPPLNNYSQNPNQADPEIPYGQTWVNAADNPQIAASRMFSLKAWWMGQLINQERNIREKMNLFWHNHFATEMTMIKDPRYAYKHHALLRANCLGNFKNLVKEITIDPAMLVYLNGDQNTKNAPDENYARELQELFTVGKDLPSHYTEEDVKQAARVLTGWRNNRTSIASYFDSNKHDTGNKPFSSFYNNTVITGKTGAAGANEVDDLITMIFNHQEVSKYIVRKIYRYFVYYLIDSTVETNVIEPLALIFRNNNYDIKPVMETLLKSEHFYDPLNSGCMIKPAVDFAVGISRMYNLQFPPASNLQVQYSHWLYAHQYCAILGQDLGDPPNVAGWPAYYEDPQYYELWINSDSLPKRNLFCDAMIYTGYNRNGFKLMFDCIAFADQFNDPSDPNKLIADIIKLLYPLDISTSNKDMLKTAFLLSGQTSDHYWTDAWLDYKNNPNDAAKKATVLTRLQGMYKYILGQAENQLS